ncbi:hypothetical protein [Bernardetia sp.]|uniref:hypothetical protein n=1 Tax=Bernardetia sp. TaxID=1937974 RepID=UPI0025B874EA|nr:hypothetical protein [Bernardetia sp.]
MPIKIKYLQLITKHLSGQITKKESEVLQKWLVKSPLNQLLFVEQEDLWQSFHKKNVSI